MADDFEEEFELDELDELEESEASSEASDSSEDSSDESADEAAAPHDPVLDDARTEGVIVLVPPEERRTTDRLQLTELAALLAQRSRQIDDSGHIFCERRELSDSQNIALEEIVQRRCPLVILRTLYRRGNVQYVERWVPNEMKHPPTIREYFRAPGYSV
jgi:hypothetical protein